MDDRLLAAVRARGVQLRELPVKGGVVNTPRTDAWLYPKIKIAHMATPQTAMLSRRSRSSPKSCIVVISEFIVETTQAVNILVISRF